MGVHHGNETFILAGLIIILGLNITTTCRLTFRLLYYGAYSRDINYHLNHGHLAIVREAINGYGFEVAVVVELVVVCHG